ncbi:hypothetical protein M2421_000253 [Stenotrophomonas sp. BIGb0135]|nr:hypothetical protein [Stenotrophomonas sp. BIGb0135]
MGEMLIFAPLYRAVVIAAAKKEINALPFLLFASVAILHPHRLHNPLCLHTPQPFNIGQSSTRPPPFIGARSLRGTFLHPTGFTH